MTAMRRRGVPWSSDTTNDPNVSGPVDRRDPAMRCSEPGGASEARDGREPRNGLRRRSQQSSRPMRRGRLNPSKASVVQAVGRRMVPYLVEATVIPTALFYTFFCRVGLAVGDRRCVGLDVRRVGMLGHHPTAGSRPADARHARDHRAHHHLSAQRERVRLLLPADHAHRRHCERLRPLGALRPAAHRPFRRRLLPRSARSCSCAPRSWGCSAGSRTCGRRSTCSPRRRR